MTNNLKILTILSIFVLILTGYFYFSSPFTKNQIITNNNNPDINNEDSNNNEEKVSKLSIVIFIIIIVILIVIVRAIIFFIIDFNKSKFEIKKGAETDFRKDNFCPFFFLIKHLFSEEEDKDNIQENGESFFKVLAKRILPENKIINKVVIYLDTDNNGGLNNDEYTISLGAILDEIAEFAAFTKNIEKEEDADRITNSSKINDISPSDFVKTVKEYIGKLEQMYGEKFDSYLCSYLLYYLAEEITNKINVEFCNYNGICKDIYTILSCKYTTYVETTFEYAAYDDNISKKIKKNYNVNGRVVKKILSKLLNDKPLNNVKYSRW